MNELIRLLRPVDLPNEANYHPRMEKREAVLDIQKRKSPRRIDDYVAFYHKKYEGLTRTELARKDLSFYLSLWRRKLLDHIPVTVHRKPTRKIKDPVAFYRRNYRGLTRGKLKDTDERLYQKLLRDGLIRYVPTKR